MKKELWIQMENIEALQKRESELYDILESERGCIPVVVYLKKERSIKRLPVNRNTSDCKKVIDDLKEMVGEGNVKVVEKQDDSFYEEMCEYKTLIERIADALEGIESILGNIDDSLEDLTKCVAYIPPRYHQKEGFYTLRICGQVTTE